MSQTLELPTVLTDEVQKRILQLLSEGNYLTTSCEASGIPYRTFRWWQKRWEEGDPEVHRFDKFFKSVKVASALGEATALREVRTGAPGWQGNAWFLERRHNQRWGKKETIVVQKGDDFDPSTMTEDELRAVAKGKGKRRA